MNKVASFAGKVLQANDVDDAERTTLFRFLNWLALNSRWERERICSVPLENLALWGLPTSADLASPGGGRGHQRLVLFLLKGEEEPRELISH